MSSSDLRQLRDRVILYLYEKGAGTPQWFVPAENIVRDLGIAKHDIQSLIQLLMSQGFSDNRCPMGSVNLTLAGQQEAERLGPVTSWSEAHRPPPPPIHVSHVSGGAVVQLNTGANSTQNLTVSKEDGERFAILEDVYRHLGDLNLARQDREAVEGSLEALKTSLVTNQRGSLSALASSAAALLRHASTRVATGLADRLVAAFGG